jgi:REP element-mobilizing transposase RayT
METRAAEQVEFQFKGRGGARKGAGRPKKPDAGPSHARRPFICGRYPIHVSIKLCDDVLRLRSRRCFAIVCAALAASCDRDGFRVVACSVQGSHLHLMIEAADARALARGMQAVEIRIAQGINRLMRRKGKVFAERYFVHVLATPTEVRNAQRYIFGNRANHAARAGRPLAPGYRDPYTIGYLGDETALTPGGPPLVVEPKSWLLCSGWRRAGGRSAGGAANEATASTPPPSVSPSAGNSFGSGDRRRPSCTGRTLGLPFPEAA